MKIVIAMNCIGLQLTNQLKKSTIINKNYEIHNIYNVNYLHDNAKFNELDKKKLEEADILILQYIRDGVHELQPNYEKWYKRGVINHQYIIDNFKKENTKVILIPHYTYNANLVLDEIIKQKVYSLKTNLTFKQVFKEVNIILNEHFSYDNKEIKKIILDAENKDNKHLMNLDKTCTLNMYDFVIKNNKKFQLFQSRHHAKTFFIQEMAIQILNYLNIEYNEEYNNFENNNISPDLSCVLKNVSKILNLEYNTEEEIITKFKSLKYYYILSAGNPSIEQKLRKLLLEHNIIDNQEKNGIFLLIKENEKIINFLTDHFDKIKAHD